MSAPVVDYNISKSVSKDDASGYVSAVFDGKSQQMDAGSWFWVSLSYWSLISTPVMELLDDNGFIPECFVEGETKVFYNSLGIDGERSLIQRLLEPGN